MIARCFGLRQSTNCAHFRPKSRKIVRRPPKNLTPRHSARRRVRLRGGSRYFFYLSLRPGDAVFSSPGFLFSQKQGYLDQIDSLPQGKIVLLPGSIPFPSPPRDGAVRAHSTECLNDERLPFTEYAFAGVGREFESHRSVFFFISFQFFPFFLFSYCPPNHIKSGYIASESARVEQQGR